MSRCLIDPSTDEIRLAGWFYLYRGVRTCEFDPRRARRPGAGAGRRPLACVPVRASAGCRRPVPEDISATDRSEGPAWCRGAGGSRPRLVAVTVSHGPTLAPRGSLFVSSNAYLISGACVGTGRGAPSRLINYMKRWIRAIGFEVAFRHMSISPVRFIR
ncbi:hypothetical protein EVAR_33552_1 [Eumeta japonica]|uniref:Uncharacterized protein n=1 Tax=Eumeta variegata TaxID=151549 RepID=A0A4C1VK65_EUMVA|nr:hypothetical protein EVAR_33552_1 [Eumeta japonica]